MSVKLGNTNIAGTQILYSTTGNNTDGAMTQNATTTELNNTVHKTGDETIGGVKTFTDTITALRFKGNNGINNNIDFMHPSKNGGWYLNADRLDNSSWYEIMTACNFQVVSTLPANPDINVFYLIPE